MNDEIAQRIVDEIKVAPQSKIDQAQWHVCGTSAQCPGCVETVCSVCGCKVYFSDDQPKLKKICLKCVTPMIMADDKPEMLMTPSAAQKAADILQQKLWRQ